MEKKGKKPVNPKIPSNYEVHSADELMAEYFDQSKAIIYKAKAADRQLSLEETKKLNELARAIERLERATDPSIAMTILARFVNFSLQIDRKFTHTLVGFAQDYVKELQRKLPALEDELSYREIQQKKDAGVN